MKRTQTYCSKYLFSAVLPPLRLVMCALSAVCFTAISSILVGCASDELTDADVVAQLDSAELLVEREPAKAFEILSSVDRGRIRGDEDIARYALLYSEACYYNRIFVDVDSLSHVAVEYYSDGDMHNERARAHFQQGYVMYNAHKYPEAMVSFMDAEEALAECDNQHLRGVVYRTKGDIYHQGGLYQNSYESYEKAYQCFERCGLPYHMNYSKYNMGRAATMIRDFELADSLFNEARNYAIANSNMDFLCVVLHELSEMYLLQSDYANLARIVKQFEEYDCAKWLISHYYGLRAIVELKVNHNLKAVDQYLALAETHPQRDEEIIEKARYLLYKEVGDDSKALASSEKLLLRQSEYMVDILAQPVLNYQINLLQSHLEREEQEQQAILRERQLSQQRNIAIYISLTIIIIVVVANLRLRMAQKDRDIANYVAMIDELQLTRNDISQPMADAVDRLYNDRLKDLNRLCETFYEHSDSSRQVSKVFEEVRLTIESIKSDEARIAELERMVDSCRNNLMAKLREQCPKLNEKELRVALYSYAGFSSRAISIFVDSNPVALSKIKYRMKTKIKECGGPEAEMLIQNLTDR